MSSVFTRSCKNFITKFIQEDFHGAVAKMTLLDAFLFWVKKGRTDVSSMVQILCSLMEISTFRVLVVSLQIVHFIDKKRLWHRLPVILGLGYLAIRRHLHQVHNLLNVGDQTGLGYNPGDYPYRTPDGRYNDPYDEVAGSANTFYGRNTMPVDQKDKVITPHPAVVATKLLARKEYKDTGKQFNMVAASWIQFMIHDWIDHLEDTKQVELIAPTEIASQCPLTSFKFYTTKEVPTGLPDISTGSMNTRTSWWDGSAIYGQNAAMLQKVREFKDGKLKIAEDGLLPHDEDGVALSGDVRGSWIGTSTLLALFVREHNAVCDMLKKEHPEFGDEELYRRGRLVTAAVIAKVHTIDWTVELLKTDTLLAAMRANWYGVLGKWFKDTFGHIGNPLLGGLVGLKKPENHGVPYSLTEDFVSVYRLHSLLPEEFLVRDISTEPASRESPPVSKRLPVPELIGSKGEKVLSEIGFTRQMVSMGHQACGALELWNYPNWLRNVTPQDPSGSDRPDHVDLPALEVYRDRERKVARYNEFRRRLLMIPITKWQDLTDDKEAIQTLTEVYGDRVEELDLLVGLMAEKKIRGFAISETAFFVFLLMASRRLEADRFFTSCFNEATYTKEGLAWVNATESLRDVIDRHCPGMTEKWMNCDSAFTVWDAAASERRSWIPLYLRIPWFV